MTDLNSQIDHEHLLDDNKVASNAQKLVIRKLTCVFLLSCTFMIIEIVGGIISNSLAILADAGHLFSDLLGFMISIVSVWISGLPANLKHTYGYHRAGVIGALASVMIIWALTGFLIYYAVERVIHIDTIEVGGKVMFFTACFGLLTNIVMIKVLNWESSLQGQEEPQLSRKGSLEGGRVEPNKVGPQDLETNYEALPCRNDLYSPLQPLADEEVGNQSGARKTESIVGEVRKSLEDGDLEKAGEKKGKGGKPDLKKNFNIRATIIHIMGNRLFMCTGYNCLGDMIQSIGVIIAAGLIWIDPVNLRIADPIVTFVFSVIVMCTTIRIVRDCVKVLMEATPSSINIDHIISKIKNVQGVLDIHNFHVWSISEEKPAMSVHIYTNNDPTTLLERVTKICRLNGIYYTTIQVETVKDTKHLY